jgi:uncharacterized protein YdaU (DUF1376 family)
MKDPAALLYIDTWLTSTAGIDADVRGWYLNLVLHQYDKKDLPNDIEELAVLAGVKFSEYKRFEHVFEHVFKQKFKINENGRLENEIAKEIIRKNPEQKGSSHWKWNNGITNINVKVRNSNEYISWRKIVFYRDKYRCVQCGSTKNIEAHHIKHFAKFIDLRFSVDNGITLCKLCHKKIHSKK